MDHSSSFFSSSEAIGWREGLGTVVRAEVEAAADTLGPFVSSSKGEGLFVAVGAKVEAAAAEEEAAAWFYCYCRS